MNRFNDKLNDAHLRFCTSRSNQIPGLSQMGHNFAGNVPRGGIVSNRESSQYTTSFADDGRYCSYTNRVEFRDRVHGTPEDTLNNKTLSYWAAKSSFNDF